MERAVCVIASWVLLSTACSAAWHEEHLNMDQDMREGLALFKEFMVNYNRSYPSREEGKKRFQIFLENMEKAQRLQENELGTAEYGVTKFSDLTGKEFEAYYLNSKLSQADPPMKQITVPDFNAPESCDWREKKAVTRVKNQGSTCHSCWAFAAVGNIESLWFLKHHQLFDLSVQELIDCDKCASCEGGYPWDAFLTVLRSQGLVNDTTYPYTGRKTECSQRSKGAKVAWIQDFAMLPKDETEMAKYVKLNGPITAIMNKAGLQNYRKGIINPEKCDNVNVDHVILIVGYGVKNKMPYWIIKNSWGEDWGEKGYFRLYRGNNTCGIKKYPVTAIIS